MKNNSPLIISVTGWSGSGKTTFCEKLIAELARRGYRVSAAKNSHHPIRSDKPGSDSDRFYNAGAAGVCLNTAESMTLFFKNRIESGDALPAVFPDSDFIVAEGFKANGAFRIEVTGIIESADEMKNPATETDMIVFGSERLAEQLRTESPLNGKPVFIQRDEVFKAANYICSRLSPP